MREHHSSQRGAVAAARKLLARSGHNSLYMGSVAKNSGNHTLGMN
eukprot:CAMPEP_0204226784 /NCGR_PEP_ID=MMETSP0361-20130328/85185_1 /ASSEMBLY_ACC=CAM_ASM_000343 /TAXON_ID=268821 /ORGANISM="Scrippsiella Hangoei, Strain SHTV-5" /LENGTH=44 /DNA_ID= /DNA_START= /DNA_END= /DNA_ORIENTATION=